MTQVKEVKALVEVLPTGIDESCYNCCSSRETNENGYEGWCAKADIYLKTLSDRCCENYEKGEQDTHPLIEETLGTTLPKASECVDVDVESVADFLSEEGCVSSRREALQVAKAIATADILKWRNNDR